MLEDLVPQSDGDYLEFFRITDRSTARVVADVLSPRRLQRDRRVPGRPPVGGTGRKARADRHRPAVPPAPAPEPPRRGAHRPTAGVLTTAYLGGDFEQPREVDSTDLADRLGITQSTFSQHVRTAQCKMISTLYEEHPLGTAEAGEDCAGQVASLRSAATSSI